MRAEAVAKITRLYPFSSGCGALANHPLVHTLAGRPTGEAWVGVEGGKLLVSLDDHVGRAAFYVGDLDRKVSAVIDRFVKPGDTVLDIGANIGLVSLRLSERVGARGTVHAFEPNPLLSRRLIRSLDENDITNVRVHEFALGEKSSTLPMSVPAGNAGAASLVPGRGRGGTTLNVPVRRLDDLICDRIAFAKIDVEGFEENVLRGFSRTLTQSPPSMILFEQNEPRGAAISLLREVGYDIAGIAKTFWKLTLEPVSSWSPAYNDYLATLRCR